MAYHRKNLINDRESLTAYILRKMGVSNFNIELDQESMDDAIDDIISVFLAQAYDGADRNFLVLTVTPGTREYKVPEHILHVVDILKNTGISVFPEISSGTGQYYMNPFLTQQAGGSTYDYLGYQLTMSHLDEMESALVAPVMFSYNSTTRKLILQSDPTIEETMLLDVFTHPEGLDEDDSSYSGGFIWNHPWIKAAVFAECMYRWGIGHIKFDAERFDGNGSVDKKSILEEGIRLKEISETDLFEKYDASQEVIMK